MDYGFLGLVYRQPNHNAGVLAVETADFDEGGRKDNAEAATPIYIGEIL